MLNNYIRIYNESYSVLSLVENELTKHLKDNGVDTPYQDYYKEEIEEYNKKKPVTFLFEKDSVVIFKKDSGYRFPLKILSKVKNNEKYICLQHMGLYIKFLQSLTAKYSNDKTI